MVHALNDDTSPSTVRFLSSVEPAVSNDSERPCIATKAKVLKAFAKKFPLTLGPGLKLVEVIGDPMDGTFAVYAHMNTTSDPASVFIEGAVGN